MRHRLALSCSLLISACSGGTDGGASAGVPREPLVPIIPEEILAPTGSATYEGGVGLRFTAPSTAQLLDLLGDLTLDVNFDRTESAVTGFAAGFSDNATAYTGTLFITGGSLDDTSGGLDFAAQLSGSLQQAGDTYLIFGTAGGEFLGDGQQVATGQLLGTARQAGRDAVVSGQFQAARQP